MSPDAFWIHREDRIILEQSGYTVLEASGGKEAIELTRSYRGSIDLLLSDIVMPGMSGQGWLELFPSYLRG